MSEPPPPQRVLLLVEDNEDDVLFFRRAVDEQALNIPLAIAKDGQQAVDYLAGNPPYSDRVLHPAPLLVLLDLRMPRKSGFDVLEWMKREPNATPPPRVFVFTSSSEPEDIRRANELGAAGYIVKPMSMGPLKQIVKGLALLWHDPEASVHGALGWHVRAFPE
jgi:CheY-like chemotaxis protein